MSRRIQMTRIETPAFAPEHARRERVNCDDGLPPEQFQRMQQHRDALLAAAHKALEEHFAECALPDKDSFPYRGALTGEYYWAGTEDYGLAGTPPRPSVMLCARCLGKRRGKVGDYAGVDITLLFHPDGTFTTYDTGTHVI